MDDDRIREGSGWIVSATAVPKGIRSEIDSGEETGSKTRVGKFYAPIKYRSMAYLRAKDQFLIAGDIVGTRRLRCFTR